MFDTLIRAAEMFVAGVLIGGGVTLFVVSVPHAFHDLRRAWGSDS